MSKVIVLGGAGAVGSVAVRTLARHPEFSEVVIGDFNTRKSEELRSQIGSNKITCTAFNADDSASIHKAIGGCDVVLNCVGPFYSTVKPILSAAID